MSQTPKWLVTTTTITSNTTIGLAIVISGGVVASPEVAEEGLPARDDSLPPRRYRRPRKRHSHHGRSALHHTWFLCVFRSTNCANGTDGHTLGSVEPNVSYPVPKMIITNTEFVCSGSNTVDVVVMEFFHVQLSLQVPFSRLDVYQEQPAVYIPA